MSETVVIVGAGQAGAQAAASLRDEKFEGRIVLIGDEQGLPYQRPPLSKAYMKEDRSIDSLWLRAEKFYQDKAIEVVPGERVTGIDRAGRKVVCASGRELGYDHLILATGVRNRALPLPGLSAEAASSVFYLRDNLDADRIKARVKDAKNVVVIGAGFIGLEFAAVASGLGLGVNVLDVAPRPMARAVTEEMSAYFLDLHRANGVNVLCGIKDFRVREDNGRIVGVELADGQLLPADFLMVGIGVVPNSELAEQAGLAVGNGIVVDEFLSTADAAISAIGDCCVFPSPFAEGLIRLESVQNAADQARAVAAKIMNKKQAYRAAPWFWSDQYAAKLQIVGLTQERDEVVVAGDVEQHKFSVFCFKQKQLVGIESVNMPSDHMAGRKMWKGTIALRPDDVREPGFSLKAYEAALRVAEKT